MAVSSLTRFTVPLGGNQSATNQGLLMPKLQFRFRGLFENFGVSKPTTELTKQVMTAGRPSVEFDDVVLDAYNSRIKIAGKPKWNDISIVIRDDATGAVSNLVGEQIQKQFDFFEQASAASAGDYKFTTRIEILDGGNGATAPTVLETWEMYGTFISQVDYGDMAYNSNDPALITLNVKFDNATQTYGTGGSNWVTPTPGDAVN